MSKAFTAFDGWADMAGAGLCPCCGWGYTHVELRTRPHLVTQAGEFTILTVTAVHQLLAAGPLDPEAALIVPLRPGRKHLLPDARWGLVTVDDMQLAWTASDPGRLAAVARLRRDGFGSRMLTQPAPPWQVLHRHPASSYPRILADWRLLDLWRSAPPWIHLALHVTLQETS